MRLLLLILALALALPCRAAPSDKLTRGDIHFFFESVCFINGEWNLKLSSNTHGMSWKLSNAQSDHATPCQPGQSLVVPANTSLEIKNKNLKLSFVPTGKTAYEVHLVVNSEGNPQQISEHRWALINPLAEAKAGYRLTFVKD